MKKINVALFPSGSQIALEINRALRDDKNINLIALTSVDDASVVNYDTIVKVPFVKEPHFYDVISQAKREYEIDYIIPCNELALEYLRGHSPHPNEAIDICNDKLFTYNFFRDVIPCPEVYSEGSYPVPAFVKPRKGHSAKGCKLIQSMDYVTKNDELILEYLPDEEYTIDCFSIESHLIYIQPRQRETILGGVAIKTSAVDNDDFDDIAKVISKMLNLNGAWFFQVKYKKGTPYLMEVGLRIAGSSALSRLNGVNLPLAEIYMREGEIIKLPSQNKVNSIYRSLDVKAELPPYRNLYIDLDDTLIIDGKLNHRLMSFIYKYDWQHIAVLTRNKDAVEELNKRGISIRSNYCPFDEVISVPKMKKSSFIRDYAIFIDDSFAEREEVRKNVKDVYCMDVSMIDAFI